MYRMDQATVTGDVVCESCGYRLTGLPIDGRCPECGTPVAESTVDSGRSMTAWETSPSWRTFAATTAACVLRPARFFRGLRSRVIDDAPARRFAARHLALASVLAATAVVGHYDLVLASPLWIVTLVGWFTALGLLATLAAGVSWLAARLTVWEASWRDMRLPAPIVRRGLDYHAAHAPVAAALPLAVVVGYRGMLLVGLDDGGGLAAYVLTLAAVTTLAAIYLFWTYWTAMRNLLHANV